MSIRINKICQICTKNYLVVPCRVKTSKFCSRICQLKGQIWTEERKRKIGNATSGRRDAIRGEKHYYWKGGSWNYWKEKTRERDKDVCQCKNNCKFHKNKRCNFSDSFIMHVDHTKPKKLFPKLALDINNLVTLCPNCHQYKTNKERRLKIFRKNV